MSYITVLISLFYSNLSASIFSSPTDRLSLVFRISLSTFLPVAPALNAILQLLSLLLLPFPQSPLKSFPLALSFHSVSVFSFFPPNLSIPKSLLCFQQRLLQSVSPTIATSFLPFVVVPSHCCFCYISLLGSMIHIQ